MPSVGKARTAKQDAALGPGFDKNGNPKALDHPVYGDGCEGLHKQVRPTGGYCYFIRFTSPVTKTRRRYVIDDDDRNGKIGKISLGEAREITRQVRALIPAGIDPLEARKGKKNKNRKTQGKQVTFKERAEKWAYEVRGPDFKHGLDDSQYTRLVGHLKKHIYPKIGDLAVGDVKRAEILSVLKPLDQAHNDTMNRVRQTIRSVLQECIDDELIPYPNHADKEKLQSSLGRGQRRKQSTPRASIGYERLPNLFEHLKKERWDFKPHYACLAFTILTNPRSGAAVALDWESIDLKKEVWTLKSGDSKTWDEHTIALSDRAIEILKAQRTYDPLAKKQTGLVFLSQTKGKQINTGTILDVIKEYGKSIGVKATVHGCRSCFLTFFEEEYPMDFSHTAKKLSMQHVVGGTEEVPYNRATVLAQRQSMMNVWADYCYEGNKPRPQNVVHLAKAKKKKAKAKKARRASK